MDIYKVSDSIYNKVLNGQQLPKDSETLSKINDFLDKYPKTLAPEKREGTPWVEMPVNVLYTRSIQTAIDIINDISDIITNKSTMSQTTFHRQLFMAFTKPERRLYVGFWLVFLSFVLYFIDSAA